MFWTSQTRTMGMHWLITQETRIGTMRRAANTHILMDTLTWHYNTLSLSATGVLCHSDFIQNKQSNLKYQITKQTKSFYHPLVVRLECSGGGGWKRYWKWISGFTSHFAWIGIQRQAALCRQPVSVRPRRKGLPVIYGTSAVHTLPAWIRLTEIQDTKNEIGIEKCWGN